MITKHVSLWYNIIYNMIKLQDNYLFYFAKICLKYTSSNMFWIVLLNKNLRTFWGWFVIKHPINKNSISLTSEIVCSYMRVFTVLGNLDDNIKQQLPSGKHSHGSLERDLNELIIRAFEFKIFSEVELQNIQRLPKRQTCQFGRV